VHDEVDAIGTCHRSYPFIPSQYLIEATAILNEGNPNIFSADLKARVRPLERHIQSLEGSGSPTRVDGFCYLLLLMGDIEESVVQRLARLKQRLPILDPGSKQNANPPVAVICGIVCSDVVRCYFLDLPARRIIE
jgi:hypothetical protein